MEPAPIVLPRIHLPDCVGMVVRERDCFPLPDEAWLAASGAAAGRPWDDDGGALLEETAVGEAAEGMSGCWRYPEWLERVLLLR